MTWSGYFTYGGVEFLNAERTAAYVKNGAGGWFSDPMKSTDLHNVLGQTEYRSAFLDDTAPWIDKNVAPDSFRFWGLYPLNITGIEDSSRTSTITENIGDGGNGGLLRHGTKQIVFSCLLLGADDAAAQAGFDWLKSVLLGSAAGGCRGSIDCGGDVLGYFSAEPPWNATDNDCGLDYQRYLQRVTFNSGPTITQKNTISDGSAVWTVSFTAVAAIPWEFGISIPAVVGMFNPGISTADKFPLGGDHDSAGHVFAEVSCPKSVYHPVFDPACPDLVLPPTAPVVKFGCFTPPSSWLRTSFEIPSDVIPLWTDVVPYISIETRSKKLQNMRVRIYKNPDGSFNPDLQPCQFISDFWITYAPEFSTMVIDGRDKSVLVLDTNSRRADGLVFDSNHTPFTWPVLSCGIGYTVTIDFLQTQVKPYIDFSLIPRIR